MKSRILSEITQEGSKWWCCCRSWAVCSARMCLPALQRPFKTLTVCRTRPLLSAAALVAGVAWLHCACPALLCWHRCVCRALQCSRSPRHCNTDIRGRLHSAGTHCFLLDSSGSAALCAIFCHRLTPWHQAWCLRPLHVTQLGIRACFVCAVCGICHELLARECVGSWLGCVLRHTLTRPNTRSLLGPHVCPRLPEPVRQLAPGAILLDLHAGACQCCAEGRPQCCTHFVDPDGHLPSFVWLRLCQSLLVTGLPMPEELF
jgi:hypothetical protein